MTTMKKIIEKITEIREKQKAKEKEKKERITPETPSDLNCMGCIYAHFNDMDSYGRILCGHRSFGGYKYPEDCVNCHNRCIYFLDGKKFPRLSGDPFYDSWGQLRYYNDWFYDWRDYWSSWDDPFYDSNGNLCRPQNK